MPTAAGTWIQLQLPSSTVITKYRIAPVYFGDSYKPTLVLLLGSTDGTNWIKLDQRNPFTIDVYGPGQHHTYNISNTTSYSYYRLIFLRGGAYGYALISGFYLSDSSNTNYPPGYLPTATSDGYVLTNSSDLRVTINHAVQPNGTASWNNLTENIANPNYINGGQNDGGDQYPGSNGYYYNGSVAPTTYSLPLTAPDAPTSLSASALDQSVSISFTPGSDGGSAITNYKYSIDNGSSYTECSPAVTSSPIVITGLTNGQSYSIKLRAVNSLGDGTPSNTVTVTPHTVPDAPTNLVASYNGSGSVSISFTPGSNGGMTISNYQYSIDCGVSFTPLSPIDGISPVTISGLTNGQTYCIELKAVNSAGAGIASSSVEYTASGLPGAPTSITWSDVYNGTISVSFVSGSSEGSPILNYKYSLDEGNTFTVLNPIDSLSPITISGLTQRTNYNLVLKAINANGDGTPSDPVALYYMCFLEGSKILCYDPDAKEEVERPVESLRKGDLVKTTMDGYKAIDTIGTSKIYNPANSMRSKNRLYKCSKENYPELKEDLVITGCHAVLVKELSDDERKELIEIQGKIYVTEDYYRLIACVDKRAQPYEKEGLFNIWHFALENDNYYFNYGVFANGLKVETASKRMMKEMSGMDLIQ